MVETHLLQPNEHGQNYFLFFALQQFGEPGSEEPRICVTPVTWQSTMKLQPWVSGQMCLSHLQAAPLVSGMEGESEQKEKKADFGAQCLYIEYLFFTIRVWKQ